LGFIGLNLIIVFINLDHPGNRRHFHNLAFVVYFFGLAHFFKLLYDALLERGWLYALVNNVNL
jgi:predicted ferric reductase